MFRHYQKGDHSCRTLIFLHGFMGSHHDWDQVIESLYPKYHCISLDLPGHGDHQDLVEKDLYLKEFSNLIHSFGKVSLVGYSMGGRVLFDFLKKRPQILSHIESVFFESAHPGLQSKRKRLERILADSNLLQNINSQSDLDAFLQQWYQLPLFGNISNHKDYCKIITSKRIHQTTGWRRCLDIWGLGQQRDCSSIADQQPNFHYIYGELDKKYSTIAQETFSKNQRWEIKGSGHNCHFEKIEQYIKIISTALPPRVTKK